MKWNEPLSLQKIAFYAKCTQPRRLGVCVYVCVSRHAMADDFDDDDDDDTSTSLEHCKEQHTSQIRVHQVSIQVRKLQGDPTVW